MKRIQLVTLVTHAAFLKATPEEQAPIHRPFTQQMLDYGELPNKTVALLRKQPMGTIDPSLQNRHWYTCVGPQFPEATPEEVAAGIEASSDVCCTREMTFHELCCMDFTNLAEYLAPGNAPPYGGAKCGVMALAAAQIPAGQPGALLDDMQANPQAPAATVCTSQMASADIAASQGGGASVLNGQQCLVEEFATADITSTSGAVVLDGRIQFLQKQGIPAASIPVCHAQVQSCLPTSGRGRKCNAENGGVDPATCPPNSASAAALQGIGQPMALAEQEREEDEMARAPGNQATAGTSRRLRSYMKTLRMLTEMSETELDEVLGPDKHFTLMNGDEVVRMRVTKATSGSHFVLDGELMTGSGRIEVQGDTAELVTGSGRKALDLDGMVLSSVGRVQATVGRRGGGMASGGSFRMGSGGNAGGAL